jgi:hypothetical protein
MKCKWCGGSLHYERCEGKDVLCDDSEHTVEWMMLCTETPRGRGGYPNHELDETSEVIEILKDYE